MKNTASDLAGLPYDPLSMASLQLWKQENQEDNRPRIERLLRNLPLAMEEELTPRQRQIMRMRYSRNIFERVLGLIEQYLPDEMAIEAPFFGKNVQSMLKLGRAQGVAMAAALSRDIPITEYAPLKIKMSITGNGSASKEQVAAMLQRILHIPDENMPPLLDATDGLAAALCHFYQTNRPHLEKSYNSWKDFINKNPDKVSSGKKSDKK